MSDPTLQDIEERFVYHDMSAIDGKDVTYLLQRISELDASVDHLQHAWAGADERATKAEAKLAALLERLENVVSAWDRNEFDEQDCLRRLCDIIKGARNET